PPRYSSGAGSRSGAASSSTATGGSGARIFDGNGSSFSAGSSLFDERDAEVGDVSGSGDSGAAASSARMLEVIVVIMRDVSIDIMHVLCQAGTGHVDRQSPFSRKWRTHRSASAVCRVPPYDGCSPDL